MEVCSIEMLAWNTTFVESETRRLFSKSAYLSPFVNKVVVCSTNCKDVLWIWYFWIILLFLILCCCCRGCCWMIWIIIFEQCCNVLIIVWWIMITFLDHNPNFDHWKMRMVISITWVFFIIATKRIIVLETMKKNLLLVACLNFEMLLI